MPENRPTGAVVIRPDTEGVTDAGGIKARPVREGHRVRRFYGRHSSLVSALLFIAPWVLGFAAFQLYPIIMSAYYSLTAYNIARSPFFIGLDNYITLFTRDPLFYSSLLHSVIFAVVSVPLNLVVAFFIAVLLNRPMPGRGILRAVFFLPSVVPSVANAMLWVMLLRTRGGLVNVALGWLHIPPVDWLYSPRWALPALILVNIWTIGPPMVIFLAGLQNVPRQLYEAARIDGAQRRHLLWHVTIPMVSPIIVFNLVIGIITSFQAFALPFVIFGYVGAGSGGPADSALLYSVRLFNEAFVQFDMGYAAAMAWVMTVIIFVLSLLSIRLSRRYVHYDE